MVIKPGEVYCGDSAKLMKDMSDGLVKLTVTSPPYDSLRSYKGNFDFKVIAKQLYRVTMDGGVVVWVVADALVGGSETGSSFRQALYFMEVGFKLHDTMIYCKQNPIPRRQKRYTPQFEYMFVFVKNDLTTFNPIMEPCKYAGVKSTGKYFETQDTVVPFRQSAEKGKEKRIASQKVRGNVWTYWVGRNTSQEKKDGKVQWYHPAKMNLDLAKDHISTWSNLGDLVFDPLCGSGTTLVAAQQLERNFLGFDISEEYTQIAISRLKVRE